VSAVNILSELGTTAGFSTALICACLFMSAQNYLAGKKCNF
jgi:hypothetical protein